MFLAQEFNSFRVHCQDFTYRCYLNEKKALKNDE